MNAFASLARSVRRSCHRVLASTRQDPPERGLDRVALLAETIPATRPASPGSGHGLNPRQTAPDASLDNPRAQLGREKAPAHALARVALLSTLNHPLGDGHCRPWLDALVLDAPAAAVRTQVLEELYALLVLAERLPVAPARQLSTEDHNRTRALLDAMKDGIDRIDAAIGSLKADSTASRGFDRIHGNLQLIAATLWRAQWL